MNYYLSLLTAAHGATLLRCTAAQSCSAAGRPPAGPLLRLHVGEHSRLLGAKRKLPPVLTTPIMAAGGGIPRLAMLRQDAKGMRMSMKHASLAVRWAQ